MLTQAQERYSNQSGLRDIMIAEKEVVLTFLLQLLSERGILDRLAFKGGTCLRKMFIGAQGRFSTDLDFTGTEEHDHEDLILDMMEAFDQPYHGIHFAIPDEGYYETQEGLSWGVNPTYSHDWNQGWQRNQAADQPPRNTDATDVAAGADRAEIFQVPAVRAC
jgi:hypothetical protein